MAYPLLGFPAEDVPCRTEPMSDQQLQHASCGTRLYKQLSFCTRRTVGSLAGFKLVTWVLPMSGDFTVSWPRHMPQHCGVGGCIPTWLPGCKCCPKPSTGCEAGNLLQQQCKPGCLQCELVMLRLPFQQVTYLGRGLPPPKAHT